LLPALLLILALAVPASTSAHHRGDLWATVNICDTKRNPNKLGIRASMPGNGTTQMMWMRFHAQYFESGGERWRDVAGSSKSPWVKVGDARFRSRQAGRKFEFDPPLPTASYVLRGVVDYQWRRGAKVVKRARQVTLRDHRTGKYGDPYDYSWGTCEIKFP